MIHIVRARTSSKEVAPARGHIFAFFVRDTERLPDNLPATTVERTDGDVPAKVVAVIASYMSGSPRKAKILAAQTLVRAVRAFDNGIRDHFAALSVFDSSWTRNDRNDRINKVVEFSRRSALIVDVRDAVNTLGQMIDWSAKEPDEVRSSYELGESYLFNLGGPDSPTPFKDETQMEDFFRKIRKAKTPDEVTAIRGGPTI